MKRLFVIKDPTTGLPTAGLTPTWYALKERDGSNVPTPDVSFPITEEGSGFYSVDVGISAGELFGIVNAGNSIAQIGRYIPVEMPYIPLGIPGSIVTGPLMIRVPGSPSGVIRYRLGEAPIIMFQLVDSAGNLVSITGLTMTAVIADLLGNAVFGGSFTPEDISPRQYYPLAEMSLPALSAKGTYSLTVTISAGSVRKFGPLTIEVQ